MDIPNLMIPIPISTMFLDEEEEKILITKLYITVGNPEITANYRNLPRKTR